MQFVELLLLLIAAHALADYPLQGDFLARAKNPLAPLPGVPWWHAMGGHAAIHGGFVGVITGVWWLGLLEFVAHFAIDTAKCYGKLDYDEDQATHIWCKLLWVLLVI